MTTPTYGQKVGAGDGNTYILDEGALRREVARLTAERDDHRAMLLGISSERDNAARARDEALAAHRQELDRRMAAEAELTAANQRAAASVEAVARANAERAALIGAAYEAAARCIQGAMVIVPPEGVNMREAADSFCKQFAFVLSQCCPADATAALDRVRTEAWNAAIYAAAKKALDRQGRKVMGSGQQNAAYDIGVHDAHAAILALRKPQEPKP